MRLGTFSNLAAIYFIVLNPIVHSDDKTCQSNQDSSQCNEKDDSQISERNKYKKGMLTVYGLKYFKLSNNKKYKHFHQT